MRIFYTAYLIVQIGLVFRCSKIWTDPINLLLLVSLC